MLKYGIFGANGKMGKKLQEVSRKFVNDAKPVKFFVSNNPTENESLFSFEEAKNLDFIIDFSHPNATINLLKTLKGSPTLVVCGTTGFSETQFQELQNLSKNVKILYSANFSIGVNKVFELIKKISLALQEYEVEILEKHHSQKKDAPSGTAIEMGKIIAESRKLDFEKVKSFDRNHLRNQNEIGFASVRQGKINGFHEVSFVNENEKIWVGHEAFNKNIFAEGAIEIAIKACKKLADEKYGLFSINEIENL